MRNSDAENTDTSDIHLCESGAFTFAQLMGNACAVCHARWPRPRHRIGESPDGEELLGCEECAGFAAEHTSADLEHVLVAH
ncbi:hypothetical protein GCM10027570_23920 [Streptomonospora sediminis]